VRSRPREQMHRYGMGKMVRAAGLEPARSKTKRF
jgi:hypothetical protein